MADNNRDYLNVIERKIIDELRIFFNTVNSSANDGKVHVSGQFPETEELSFPSVIVQQIGSGFEEQFIGEKVTFGGNKYSGEIYGIGFLIHIFIDKEAQLDVGTTPQGSSKYRQRRLLNWMMLNIANVLNDIDWATEVTSQPAGLSYNPNYDASVDVQERHLQAWRDVGYSTSMQWWGASAQFMLTFLNYRS
mgnify:FL=1|tara:strand:+ start:782 stop:1357 length:576 start_codon:yes stop_codon:yes gene_type:complete